LNEQEKKINFEDILDALQKKWYWVTIPFIFFMFLGLWLYVVLPKEYESSTLIFIEPQEIPSNYVMATVTSAVEQRVKTLALEVMSRTNLEQIITEMKLYPRERTRGVPIEILVNALRKKINVTVAGNDERNRTSSFTISFRWFDPTTAADVTNRLASLIIESNTRMRSSQASETTVFLEKQLADLKISLEEYEKKLQAFKTSHMGELPEQVQTNTATLINLQNSLDTIQRTLTDARNRKISIEGQLSLLEASKPGSTSSQRDQRLTELKSRLEDMKSNYTPEHPEIIKLTEQIKELESKKEGASEGYSNPRAVELRTQLRAINSEISGLERDAARVNSKINQYQGRVENAPKMEQELSTLMRDYEITKENYQKLLDKLLEAKRAENMEKRQQGEQFRILDFAKPSQSPIQTNRLRIMLICLAIGLCAGAGVILLIEIQDSTIKSISQLEDLEKGIACISAIPLSLTGNDKKLKKRTAIIFIGINIGLVIFGIIAVGASWILNITINKPIGM
jgi:polysaccharide chain length determinant protein (PEP-CTERM system associated)